MKKTLLSLICAFCALAGNAQVASQPGLDRTPFVEGKYYVAAGLSGLDLNHTGCEKWKMDLSLKGGYLFMDNWMVTAQASYNYREEGSNSFIAGAGLRYYIDQNGLFLGLGSNYVHQYHNCDDFMPSAHVGYTFFLNRTVALEPEIYYNQSTKNHSDYSGFGLRIGLGIYFE